MRTPKANNPPSQLLTELDWFVRLRWLPAVMLCLAGAVSVPPFGWSGDRRLIALAGVVLGYNALCGLFLRKCAGRPVIERNLVIFGWSQVVLDQICLTALVTMTGGLQSAFLVIMVVHVVFASLLVSKPRFASYIAAAIAVGCLSVGLLVSGQLPTESAGQATGAAWVVALIITSFVTNHMTTAMRIKERQTHRQHDFLQSVLDTVVEGIIVIDEGGTIISANVAAHRTFDYREGDLVGRNIVTLMPEPHASSHHHYVNRFLTTREPRIIGIGRELTGRRRDGSLFPLALAVSEVKEDGRSRFTGIVRDISEQKRSERDMAELNQRLLRQQQAMAQHEKMAAMGRMAAGITHEIANPLACLDSVLQLAMRQGASDKESMKTAREQVLRIRQIMNDMSAYAHPAEGDWISTEVSALIDSALQMVRFDHRIRNVQIQRDYADGTGSANVIPSALKQVLVNLIANALDAMEGVEKPHLLLRCSPEGATEVRIEVNDNGAGIPKESLKRIFDPFYTTKPVGRGTGLGLAISFSIVERHQGRIEAESKPGVGTTMSIILPREIPRSGGREDAASADS